VNQNNRTTALARLLDPVFLLSLGLLLLNDFLWKAAFHNDITGKLSDFAGLYAFVWVGITLLPKAKNLLPWLIAGLFVWWKSAFSQFAIVAWNDLDGLRMDRVVDMSDNFALMVIPLAVLRFRQARPKPWQMAVPATIRGMVLLLSIFAFVATSYIGHFPYKDTYTFKARLQSVVNELNRIDKADGDLNLELSIHHENANEFREERDIRLYFHHSKEFELRYDTTWANWADSVFVHHVRTSEVPKVDSVYLNPDGYLLWRFSNLEAGVPDSVAECRSLEALLVLEEKKTQTILSLKSIQYFNCLKMMDISYREKADDVIKAIFERQVIKPLQATFGRQ
jgi:hypothetical protein